MRRYLIAIAGGTALSLAACVIVTPVDSEPTRLSAVAPDNWRVNLNLSTGLPVVTALPNSRVGFSAANGFSELIVYIEGDGHAWQTRAVPSADPTPDNPVALRLAISDRQSENIAYVARPCQYEARKSDACESSVWTGGRYGVGSVLALSAAIDSLKDDRDQLVLVGYSGGGVMAALLAARRTDVIGFISVAANMDTEYWIKHHRVSPLDASISPLDFASTLVNVPQVHMSGQIDTIVPPAVLASYLASMNLQAQGRVISRPDFDHNCCWVDHWQQLHNEAFELLRAQIDVTRGAI